MLAGPAQMDEAGVKIQNIIGLPILGEHSHPRASHSEDYGQKAEPRVNCDSECKYLKRKKISHISDHPRSPPLTDNYFLPTTRSRPHRSNRVNLNAQPNSPP